MVAVFVAAGADERIPRVSGADGRRALAVAPATYRSARLGRPVVLPLRAGDR
jgi:hypothetical protein